jgi:hypothetical protein
VAEVTAVYRAVADFSALKRQADAARRSLRRLRDESEDTHQDYVAGQEEVTEATDDSTQANVGLTKALGKVSKATRQTTKAESGRVDVIQDTVAQIGKQSAAQRENTRLEIAATRAKDNLSTAEANYTRVSADATSSDRDRAKALDDVRLASIGAAAANDQLIASMARLAVGGGGRGGRPRGPGIATDVGAFGRAAATAVGGLLSTLLLIAPTINTIIAGLVGLVSLLTVAAAGAVALAAGFIGVSAAMAIAAFRWRNLLSSSSDGVSEWRGAILAIEAAAFNMLQSLTAQFTDVGEAGTSMWDSIIDAAYTVMAKMAPVFEWLIDKVTTFTKAVSGDPGAYSPFLNFLKTWAEEWKVLKNIVSEDILPGGPGFFEKYEAPAKAFVEGIARVINGVRKFSRMGLGLNMDQLAEFITNVFDALAKLIQIIPRYSNALVTVGLAASRWLDSLIPLIDAIVKIGEIILKDFVAPLVTLALWISSHILNLPLVSWLVSLAGGFLLAAKGLTVLSFGLIKFNKVISGAYLRSLITFGTRIKWVFQLMTDGGGVLTGLASQFPRLAAGLFALSKMFTALGTAISLGTAEGGVAAWLGLGATAAAITAGYLLVTAAMHNLADAEARVKENNESLIESFARGDQTLKQITQQAMAYGKQQGDNLNILGQTAVSIRDLFTHPSRLFGTPGESLELDAQTNLMEQLNVQMQAYSDNAQQAVEDTGSLTDEQIKNLKWVEKQSGGTKVFAGFLADLDKAYKDGTITTGQYLEITQQLGVEVNSTGDTIDETALKVQGASNTIANALIAVGKEAQLQTAGITRLAESLGEDVVQFTHDATEAFLDVQGGLSGTGEKITEWFQQTSDAILAWKTQVADSFNTVKAEFTTLGNVANLTWEKFQNGIEKSIRAAESLQENIDTVIDLGASPKLLAWIAEQGPAAAGVLDVLAEKGKKGVQFANQALRKGADLGGQIADTLGDSLGLTMDKVTAAVELMVSALLDIPVNQVRKRVKDLVDGINGDLAGIREQQVPKAFLSSSALMAGVVPKKGDLGSKFETAGNEAAAGYVRGLTGNDKSVREAATHLASESITAANSALGIGSPAKKFIPMGIAVMQGFAVGLIRGVGGVIEALDRVKTKIIEVFDDAAGWLKAASGTFKGLSNVVNDDLIPAVDDLRTALENLPETINIDFDLDTSRAEAAATAFLEKMKKQGLIFQSTPTGKPVQHAGGPAGHATRFATGRPKSDEVDARLQRGEFVVSRQAVKNMGGMGTMSEFHDFIQGKRLFHDGGPVDESEEVSFKIRRLAESLGISGVTATGVLPKQKMQPLAQVSAPGAGKTAGGLTAAAANYMAVIKKNFPQITGYGTIAVRNIAGTNTWSQHAYGNAIDVMTGASTAMRQAVAFFSNQYRRILSIAHLLADPWFRSPLGDHYNHVHADFFPQYGGTPPGQPYRSGGKVRKRGGRVHQNEFVLRDSAARALGDSGLDYLNANASRYGPAAFLEAFNQSFATTAIPRMGGVGAGADGADGRALFSIAMHLDGKTISRSVDVYSREADILLPGR